MKKHYEMIREIFNKCSGNQMRDVFFDEIETDDPDAYVTGLFPGCHIEADTVGRARIYEIEAEGLRQRVSLTELEQ
jgi:hypothetical protein